MFSVSAQKGDNMPRSAGKAGPSGIGHIMLRGIDRQDFFPEDDAALGGASGATVSSRGKS